MESEDFVNVLEAGKRIGGGTFVHSIYNIFNCFIISTLQKYFPLVKQIHSSASTTLPIIFLISLFGGFNMLIIL